MNAALREGNMCGELKDRTRAAKSKKAKKLLSSWF